MKIKRLYQVALLILVFQAITQWSGIILAQGCENNSPSSVWGSNSNVGIHITTPLKPLHIFSSNVCNEASIRLEFQGPYWGHLALINPFILNSYSFIGLASDMVLQADTNAGNVLLTTRNKGKAIKFATTPSLSGFQQDRERFQISDDGYNTLVDIKATQFIPNKGNPILRFQRILPDGNIVPTPGNRWNMGIDVNDSICAFKLGAIDSTCAVFNDTKSFTFTKEGFLGIGTSKPQSPVQINRGQSSFLLLVDPMANSIDLSSRKFVPTPTPNYCRWDVNLDCDLKFKFKNDTLRTMQDSLILGDEYTKVVFSQGGNVGIGTLDPEAKLEIKGEGADGLTSTLNIFNSNGTSIFNVHDDGDLIIKGAIKNNIITEPVKMDKLLIGTGMSDSLFKLNVVGDVKVIGSTDISNDLKVYGTIYTIEVLIKDPATWPDYVFNEEYKLTSLYETAEYINKFGHLPDVPSKDCIDKDGLKLVEMQTILLKKIEELTLHMIELKKDNDLLRKEVDELKESK